jgi:hypothetical protein
VLTEGVVVELGDVVERVDAADAVAYGVVVE